MANEKRLIDLDKTFEAINQDVWWTESEKAYFRSFLVKQPKVDAVEVVHGRWVEHKSAEIYRNRIISNYECSECNDWLRDKTNYCPNCGAKMDGDGNG